MVQIPDEVKVALPSHVDPQEIRDVLHVRAGLLRPAGETYLLAMAGELLALTRASLLDPFELVELDTSGPAQLEGSQWQPELVVAARGTGKALRLRLGAIDRDRLSGFFGHLGSAPSSIAPPAEPASLSPASPPPAIPSVPPPAAAAPPLRPQAPPAAPWAASAKRNPAAKAIIFAVAGMMFVMAMSGVVFFLTFTSVDMEADRPAALPPAARPPQPDRGAAVARESGGPLAPATRGKIYLHTASTLYVSEPRSIPQAVGRFVWPSDGGEHEMTDIAIGKDGTLWGVTFDALYRCDAKTARCETAGTLSVRLNGLAFYDGALFGTSLDGMHVALRMNGGRVQAEPRGHYGPGLTSTGDVTVAGGAMYGAVSTAEGSPTRIVRFTPGGDSVGKTVVELSDPAVYGLASAGDELFAVTGGGTIWRIGPLRGSDDVRAEVLLQLTDQSWWGAASW